MTDLGRVADGDQALVDHAPADHGPSGIDLSREWAALTLRERRFLLATPRQIPADAGVISYNAGERGGGSAFAGFARRQSWLFQRIANCYGTAFQYRLSRNGLLAADAASGIEAGTGDTLAARPEGQEPVPTGDAQGDPV